MKQFVSRFRADAVVERVKTNSVLNPLLWLCGIAEATSIPAIIFSTDGVQTFFCALAASPVVAAIIAYFIWMFLDADRLQSEEYQLARHRILQGSKEENTLPIISQTTDHPAPLITNDEALAPDDPDQHSSGVTDGSR